MTAVLEALSQMATAAAPRACMQPLRPVELLLVDLMPIACHLIVHMPPDQFAARDSAQRLVDHVVAQLHALWRPHRDHCRLLTLAIDLPSRVPVPRHPTPPPPPPQTSTTGLSPQAQQHVADGRFQLTFETGLQLWPGMTRSLLWTNVVLAWQLRRLLTLGLIRHMMHYGSAHWPAHVLLQNAIYMKNETEHAALRSRTAALLLTAPTLVLSRHQAQRLAILVAYSMVEHHAYDIRFDLQGGRPASMVSQRLTERTTTTGDAVLRLLGLVPSAMARTVLLVTPRREAETMALIMLERHNLDHDVRLSLQHTLPPPPAAAAAAATTLVLDVSLLSRQLREATPRALRGLTWPAARLLLLAAGHLSYEHLRDPPLTSLNNALVALRLLRTPDSVHLPARVCGDPACLLLHAPSDNAMVWRMDVALVATCLMRYLDERQGDIELPLRLPLVDRRAPLSAVMRAGWLTEYYTLGMHAAFFAELQALATAAAPAIIGGCQERSLNGWRCVTAEDDDVTTDARRPVLLVATMGTMGMQTTVAVHHDADMALPSALHDSPLGVLWGH